MSINLYDKAFLKKIQGWIKDPNLTLVGADQTKRLFEVTADKNNDKPLQLPLIALSRGREIEIFNTNKTPMVFQGTTIEYAITKESAESDNVVAKGISLAAIQISIPYQIDIFTRYEEEANEYVRNFVFNLINYPKLTIEIPYNNINLLHDSKITLNSTIADNSEIPERLIPGQFTRMTLSCSVENAYLFSAPIRDGATIESVQTEISFKK